MNSQKTAWVAGATGLIGGHLIQQLCANPDYASVVAFSRQKPGNSHFQHEKLTWHTCDYEALSQPKEPGTDHLYCALGSTRKKTPNTASYHRIDVAYPAFFAKLGQQSGATAFALVSAHGANTRSPSSYLRMKAQAERDIDTCGFEQLIIARPSLLLGERSEHRPAEKLGEYVMRWAPGNYRAIAAHDVAAAMIRAIMNAQPGLRVLNSASMQGAHRG